jgi:hypothetical protein
MVVISGRPVGGLKTILLVDLLVFGSRLVLALLFLPDLMKKFLLVLESTVNTTLDGPTQEPTEQVPRLSTRVKFTLPLQ